VAGPATLDLWISTTAPDADVFVKISDQGPRAPGSPDTAQLPSRIVGKGWLRTSHREVDPEQSLPHRPFYEHEAPLSVEPGVIYKVTVEILAFGHRFVKDHCIRLEIVSGDSPLTDDLFVHQHAWWKVGTDTIHHDSDYPTCLWLPVVSA